MGASGSETTQFKWKARMNLHKNAGTCPRSRAPMVKRVLHEGEIIAEVARQFGVSRHTVYK